MPSAAGAQVGMTQRCHFRGSVKARNAGDELRKIGTFVEGILGSQTRAAMTPVVSGGGQVRARANLSSDPRHRLRDPTPRGGLLDPSPPSQIIQDFESTLPAPRHDRVILGEPGSKILQGELRE